MGTFAFHHLRRYRLAFILHHCRTSYRNLRSCRAIVILVSGLLPLRATRADFRWVVKWSWNTVEDAHSIRTPASYPCHIYRFGVPIILRFGLQVKYTCALKMWMVMEKIIACLQIVGRSVGIVLSWRLWQTSTYNPRESSTHAPDRMESLDLIHWRRFIYSTNIDPAPENPITNWDWGTQVLNWP